MANSAQCLLIGSIEAYSGKSGTILGLAQQLQREGLAIAYGKPIGNCSGDQDSPQEDADIAFVADVLGLRTNQILMPLLTLNTHTIEDFLHS